MKYLLLVYTKEESWSEESRAACMEESMGLIREIKEQGKFVGASPLQPVATATSVRIREGKRVITDGPFAETAEQLGGYFLIDVANLDEAIAVAARIPGAKKGTIEVRPIHALPELC